MLKKFLFLTVLSLSLSAASQADAGKEGKESPVIHYKSASEASSLEIEKPWIRASTGPNSALFMHIKNAGLEDDTLIGCKADFCEKVELHTHLKEGNVFKMRPVKDIPLKKGETTHLAPGGLHVMFLNIKGEIEPKEERHITLVFQKAGEITLPVTARQHECHCAHQKKHKIEGGGAAKAV